MASKVHVVRHGEVHNPENVVYASLPGFGLSQRGHQEARLAARYLGSQPVVAVWSSPLQRAMETAAAIAQRFGVAVQVTSSLSEWKMADSWAGIPWDDLPTRRPGQVETYLQAPLDLAIPPENLTQLAARMASTVMELNRLHPHGDIVVVSHQDPVQAARLALTGRSLDGLHQDKPRHASVVTLVPGTPWTELTMWSPSVA